MNSWVNIANFPIQKICCKNTLQGIFGAPSLHLLKWRLPPVEFTHLEEKNISFLQLFLPLHISVGDYFISLKNVENLKVDEVLRFLRHKSLKQDVNLRSPPGRKNCFMFFFKHVFRNISSISLTKSPPFRPRNGRTYLKSPGKFGLGCLS